MCERNYGQFCCLAADVLGQRWTIMMMREQGKGELVTDASPVGSPRLADRTYLRDIRHILPS